MRSSSFVLLGAFVAVLGSTRTASAAKCPLVQVVLDRSGSMLGAKWSAATSSLTDLVTKKGDRWPFGLLTFSDCGDFAGETSIAANNGTKQQILSALSTQTPSGSTNTAGGIDEAMRMIQLGLAADPGRMNKAFIILVTDGDPTCSGNGMNAMDYTIARIEAARQRGVKTFVIGMQGATAANLERMAVAGGAPCTTCTNSSGAPIKYYDATDPAKLAAELSKVTDAIEQGEGAGACDDSCYSNGCPVNQVCVAGGCKDNPCAGYSLCPPDAYCYTDGTSAPVCRPACRTTCPADHYCDPTGNCVPKPCPGPNCGCDAVECPFPVEILPSGGQQCIAGKCVDNACLFLTCPAGTTCDPFYNSCSGDLGGGGAPDMGGGGSGGGRGGRGGCDLAGGSPASSGGLLLVGAMALLVGRMMRSRRAPRG
jgi:uncharacterized protein YegL